MLTISTFEDKDLCRLHRSCVAPVCGKGGIIASHSQNVLGYPKCRTGISPGKAVSGIAPLTVSRPPVDEKGLRRRHRRTMLSWDANDWS